MPSGSNDSIYRCVIFVIIEQTEQEQGERTSWLLLALTKSEMTCDLHGWQKKAKPTDVPSSTQKHKRDKTFLCTPACTNCLQGVSRGSWNVFVRPLTLSCLCSALNGRGKKKKKNPYTLNLQKIGLRFYSIRVKCLPGEIQKVNFGSVHLSRDCFSLLKTLGEDQPYIPTALGL